VSAENVTLLVLNKERKIKKERQRKEDNQVYANFMLNYVKIIKINKN